MSVKPILIFLTVVPTLCVPSQASILWGRWMRCKAQTVGEWKQERPKSFAVCSLGRAVPNGRANIDQPAHALAVRLADRAVPNGITITH